MNRHPNHCACPRCGSRLPEEPSEFKRATAITNLRHKYYLRSQKQEKNADD